MQNTNNGWAQEDKEEWSFAQEYLYTRRKTGLPNKIYWLTKPILRYVEGQLYGARCSTKESLEVVDTDQDEDDARSNIWTF